MSLILPYPKTCMSPVPGRATVLWTLREEEEFCRVVVMPLKRCYFHPDRRVSLFALPRDAGLRDQWLTFIFNSVHEKYNLNIALCGGLLPQYPQVQSRFRTKTCLERWSSSHFKNRSCCLWATTCKCYSLLILFPINSFHRLFYVVNKWRSSLAPLAS